MRDVLIVDDSATMRASLKMMLERAELRIAQARDGAEALHKLTDGLKPAAIITDLNMPNMNGIEFIRAVRALPGMRFVPILVLTTESQQALRDAAKQAGATGWLVKPVAPAQLLGALDQVLLRA